MRKYTHTIIAAAMLATTSCAQLETLIKDPRAADLLGKLKDAIQDIDPKGVAKEMLCEQYKSKGKVLAENAYMYEWPKFAPMWQTPPNPAADKLYCETIIRDSGATIVTKKSDSGAASAVCFQAQFPKDFGKKSLEEQAAITCHEAAHIIEQDRVGCVDWNRMYFSTISARLTFEGTAYVLGISLLRRYGWTRAQAEVYLARRANQFPEKYSIPREIITDQCTLEHWTGIWEVFSKRTGF